MQTPISGHNLSLTAVFTSNSSQAGQLAALLEGEPGYNELRLLYIWDEVNQCYTFVGQSYAKGLQTDVPLCCVEVGKEFNLEVEVQGKRYRIFFNGDYKGELPRGLSNSVMSCFLKAPKSIEGPLSVELRHA